LIKLSHDKIKEIAEQRLVELERTFNENCHPKVKEEFKNLPKGLERLFLEVHAGKKSLVKATKLKCLDCCCYDKIEVSLCTSRQCPLWHFRPYQKQDKIIEVSGGEGNAFNANDTIG